MDQNLIFRELERNPTDQIQITMLHDAVSLYEDVLSLPPTMRPNRHLFAACLGDIVASVAQVEIRATHRPAHLLGIATHPGHQGSGLGTFVMENIFKFVARHHRTAIDTIPTNNDNRRFYANLGFTPVHGTAYWLRHIGE